MAQAYLEDVRCITREAAADLSAKQYYFVVQDSSGQVNVPSAAGQKCLGVNQGKPAAAGRATAVAVGGVTKVVAGGTIAIGDKIKTDANGKGVAAQAAYVNTSDSGAAQDPVVGSFVQGEALTAASSGEIFSMLIAKEGAIPTTAA